LFEQLIWSVCELVIKLFFPDEKNLRISSNGKIVTGTTFKPLKPEDDVDEAYISFL
jgi:hypothetical protein